MHTLTKITAASALFGALVAGALVPTTAHAETRPRPALTSLETVSPEIGSPAEAVGNDGVPAIGPDGTRIYSTKDRILAPQRAGTASDARAAAQLWLPGRSAGSGVRIRTTPVTGTVLGLIPFQAYLYMSCKRGGSDGWNWYWTAYNTGGRWIYGWTTSMWIYPSPDAYVPPC